MRKYFIALFFTFSLMLTGCIKDISPQGMTVVVPASKITQSLQQQFPITENTPYGKVTLTNPRALLQKGSDRITAGATVLFSNSLIQQQRGSVYISGKPVFDARTGSVFLTQPQIEKLDINNNLTQFLQGPASEIVRPFIDEVFRKVPVYTIDKKSIQGSFVKNVRVENGNLLLTFGL